MFKKIAALREQKSGIWGQVGDRVAESSLKEERKLLAAIADLQRNHLEVTECNKKEEKMKGSC